jgi:two-component system nitrate/nitrite response regulator NarL
MSVRILLIDDHPLFRKGVAQLVSAEAELELVGEANGGPEGIELAQKLVPDIILIDLNMKGMNGIQIVTNIRATGLRSRCIMLTVSNDERDVLAAMKAGADGYLLKDMEPEDLVKSIRHAAQGNVVLDWNIASILTQALNAPQAPVRPSLTEREGQILAHLAEGRSNKEIARLLEISDATVKVHIKNLLRKLNMKSRLEAAVWALHNT